MRKTGTGTADAGAATFRTVAAAAVLLLSPALARAGTKMTGGGFEIPRDSELAAGQLASSAALSLNDAVGEAGGNAYAGGGFKFNSGLMNVAAQPGSVTSIAAVTKSTGTLDLTWTAPGEDGFAGSVVSGFYRLDYSSDPAHVFAPTTFRLEFSTVVIPGSAQGLQIAGLQPNTTYYTKIYLADARKYFAEDSSRSDQSTLANIPVNPVFAAVNPSSVTISWLLPAGGAEGYSDQASTTNFGALLPGGAVVTSATANGLLVSLTIDGLTTNTTYYFKVASLNWQGDQNFTTVMATVTPSGVVPLPILNLAASLNPLSRSLSLTWQNPVYLNQQGVLVLLSTNPFSTSVADGLAFTPGQTLSDASVVKSTAMAVSFADSGLTLDTTYFYTFYTEGQGLSYSVSVSTAVFLDLPPMAPSGLASVVAPDRSTIALNWTPVSSNLDGSLFASTGAPRAVELSRYEIYQSTSVLYANWVRISTLPITASSFTAVIPDPTMTFVYKVVAVDSFGTSDAAMAQDTEGNLYAFAADGVTRLSIPRGLAPELSAAGSRSGSDILIRAKDQAVSGTDKVVRSVTFEAVKSPANQVVAPLQFSQPNVTAVLAYQTTANLVVPSGVALSGLPNIPALDAASRLGMYWNNGSQYVKFFGKVDPVAQTVSVQSAYTGPYQIRSLLRDQAFSFDISGISNKVITPNGDGLNDTVVFAFDNPRDSSVSGQIFDLRGAFVTDLGPGPRPDTLMWDGKANGRVVPGGVYVYQIRAEGKVFNGTVIVIR